MEAILFALIAYFTWGLGVFAETIAARRLSPYSLGFWAFALSFVVTSFYIPFAMHDLAGLTPGLLLFNIFLAVSTILFGTLLYYEALRIENRAIVGTIASSFPLVTVILSILFLGERVSAQEAIAILVVFVGLFLASFDIDQLRSKKFIFSRGILLAIIAMIAWGTWFAFIKIPVSKIGWFWPNYFAFLTFPPLIFIYMKIKGKKLESPTKNNIFVPLIVSTLLVRIAEFSYNLGITKGLVAVVASISGANTTLFVILAFLFLKDPIKKQQTIGIIITIFGIIFLSIVSS